MAAARDNPHSDTVQEHGVLGSELEAAKQRALSNLNRRYNNKA